MQDIILEIEKVLKTHPRRVKGSVICDGCTLRYVDLHSFYYQAKQIFEEKLYHFETDKRSPRIIDCGAHIGLATHYFHNAYPDARITSFEADPDIFSALQQNVLALGLSPEVANNQAVWTSNDGVCFSSSSDDSGHVSDNGIKVPSIRLRDFLAEEAEIDLLKLDIEGAEFAVINDCIDMLPKVRHLIVEAHFLSDPETHPSQLGQMLSKLEEIGMQYVLSDLHSATWVEDGNKTPFHSIQSNRYICAVFAWW